MDRDCVDLHTHSRASDGSDPPALLVRKAADAGLRALALTDHDTVAGLDEAEAAAQEHGIEFIRGCELAAEVDGREMHIIGLWMPRRLPEAVATRLEALQEGRHTRNRAMLENLARLGAPLAPEDLGTAANGASTGRPHMAAALLRKGYVRSVREAFERYLAAGRPAYVKRLLLSPEETLRVLSGAGATTILAHPRLDRAMTRERLERCVHLLAGYGLDGIEAYHSSHANQDVRLCLEIAERQGLAVSGGSDYHGTAKPDIALGARAAGCVPGWVLERLKARRRAKGLPV